MSKQERYIGGPTGGIKKVLLVPWTEGYFFAESGTRLYFNIVPNRISIEGFDAHQLFEASVIRRKLRFNIYNRGNGGERHPDIYARELALFSLPYFEKQGQIVNGISAFWLRAFGSKLSDNYHQYHDHLKSLGKQRIDIEDKREAAKKTWTGSLAEELGFSEVVKLRDWWNVKVLFKRPKE